MHPVFYVKAVCQLRCFFVLAARLTIVWYSAVSTVVEKSCSPEQQFRLQPLVVFTETQSPKPLFYAMLGVVVGVYRISCHVPHTVSYWSLSNLTGQNVCARVTLT